MTCNWKQSFRRKKLEWPLKGQLGLVLERNVGILSVVEWGSLIKPGTTHPLNHHRGFQNTCRGGSRGFLVWIWYAGRDICSSLGDSRITGTLRHDDCFLPGRCNMSGTYRRRFLSPTLKHPRCATSSNSPLSRSTTMMSSFSRSSRCSKSSGR